MSCNRRYDYIIVGAGTAASTLIRFLSDDPKKSVLVLEKGGDHRDDPLVDNVGYGLFGGNASILTYDKEYSQNCNCPDQYNAAIDGNFVKYQPYANGVGSGGSSQINYALSVRGTAHVYDEWAAISGDNRWTPTNLLPIQIGLEQYTGQSEHPEERGCTGALDITNTSINVGIDFLGNPADPIDLKNALSEVLTTESGKTVPVVNDYNVSGNELSVSLYQSNITPDYSFTRSYGFKEYLGEGVLDANGNGVGDRDLKVLFETTVVKVLIKNKKAIGVKYIDKTGRTNYVYSKRKVILCASVFSSTILQYSGIGDSTKLGELGIEVIVDNPNVGKNLQNHYGVTYAMTANSDAAKQLSALTPIIGFYNYDGSDDRALQIILQERAGLPEDLILPDEYYSSDPEVPPEKTYIGGNIWNLNPTPNGTAYIVNPNPTTFPDIIYNYFNPDPNQTGNDPVPVPGALEDLATAVKAYKTANALAEQLGETMLWPPAETFVGTEEEVDKRLEKYARADLDNAVTFHCSGTCRMSQSEINGVVDGTLHVHGIKDLMVADTSIAPIITDGNTGTPAYYIGAVAAEILGSTSVPKGGSCEIASKVNKKTVIKKAAIKSKK